MQPNLLDAVLLIGAATVVWRACCHGLTHEMFHTFLLAVGLFCGWLLFRDMPAGGSPEHVSKTLITLSFIILGIFLVTWMVMEWVLPFVLKHEHEIGYRSRFWAGVLAIFKVLGFVLGLNVWFALQTGAPHPERLANLPEIMQKSVILGTSDAMAGPILQSLVQANLVSGKPVLHQEVEKVPAPEDSDNVLEGFREEPQPAETHWKTTGNQP